VNEDDAVNTEIELQQLAGKLLRGILAELGFATSREIEAKLDDARVDVLVRADSKDAEFLFVVEVKSRITPQTAPSVCQQLARSSSRAIPLMFAPVISPRVAEIARSMNIGFLDGAGNCWIKSARDRLLIERSGLTTPRQPTDTSADPFSPKSSRIVRALLSQPKAGWQVRDIAGQPDVAVSVGLVSKVRKTLIEEGYTIEHKKRLYLLDPIALLNAWSERYTGPAEQFPAYLRGDLNAAEVPIGDWAKEHGLKVAVAGHSAAWRLAPEVRHSVATFYVEERGFDEELLAQLSKKHGIKRVDSGANVQLWRPFDQSVFASAQVHSDSIPTTSPLQTYLDVKRLAGRGEEAATSVFNKYMKTELESAAAKGRAFQLEQL
jgi:hypothetical protein